MEWIALNKLVRVPYAGRRVPHAECKLASDRRQTIANVACCARESLGRQHATEDVVCRVG